MTFQPVIAGGGMVAWSFLKRTYESQTEALQNTPSMQRDTEYFAANIGSIDTAEELVSDRRLMRVALGAFGLDADIDNRFFIRTVLEEGTLSTDALANKLADSRYTEFSKAFGFGDYDTPSTKLSDFGAQIVSSYQTRQFETAVGDQDDSMRLALNAARELSEIADSSTSADAKWFTVMGSAPLRSVFETALGLPSSFGQLDLDKQLEVFRNKMDQFSGNGEIDQFATEDVREGLIQRFLLMSQLSGSNSMNSSQIALTLLQT
ncbi:DUF1217 domain-containing protein [Shimia sp.]|uniref:DUF1217 domain-containing protein n=1 Tax=Shimia sp. TaxID=1954381 RepID=UPI00329985F4